MTGEEEKLKELMNKISIALKDVTLQQGFEIICKKLAELEKENGKLQGKIADLESEYYELENSKDNETTELKAQVEQLSNDNHVLKTSFIMQQEQIEKMKCCGNCDNNAYCDKEHYGNDEGCKEWECAE